MTPTPEEVNQHHKEPWHWFVAIMGGNIELHSNFPLELVKPKKQALCFLLVLWPILLLSGGWADLMVDFLHS